MEKYSTNWLTTIFAAIVFHVVTVTAIFYIAPYLSPAQKIQTVAELEWIDVEISDEAIDSEEETIPTEEVEPTTSPFNAEDLIVPELDIPEIKIPTLELPTPTPPKPVERPKPPPPAKIEQPVKPAEESPPQEGKQLLTKPPVAVNQVYPEKIDGLDFKGYVSFAARIGKDGKVKSTELIQSSGDKRVDELATVAAQKWTFQPALDQIGRPMECDTIITFDLKKIS